METRIPSRESSSKPSNVGNQAKKPKKQPTEANAPASSRGTSQTPGKKVPVHKHKTSKRNAATESQEETETPTMKATIPKLKQLPPNTAAHGRIAKPALQTTTSVTDEPDAMNAIHKEIGTLRVRLSASNQILG